MRNPFSICGTDTRTSSLMDRKKSFLEMELVVVQSLCYVQLFATLWTRSMPGSSVLHCLPEFSPVILMHTGV